MDRNLEEKKIMEYMKKERTCTYQQLHHKPLNANSTLCHMFENRRFENEKYYVFKDKSPYYDPKLNQYSFDFRGRVKESSIKNF